MTRNVPHDPRAAPVDPPSGLARPAAAPPSVRQLRIAVGSLAFLLAAFVAVLLFALPERAPRPALASMLLVVLGVLTVSEVAAYLVIRSTLLSSRLPAGAGADRASLERAYHGRLATSIVIAAGLISGVGLFGAVIHLITSNLPALAAPMLAIIFLLALLPTPERFAAKVAELIQAHEDRVEVE